VVEGIGLLMNRSIDGLIESMKLMWMRRIDRKETKESQLLYRQAHSLTVFEVVLRGALHGGSRNGPKREAASSRS